MSATELGYFNDYYSAPTAEYGYRWPDYVLQGSGRGLVLTITGTDAQGSIYSVEVQQQGSNHAINAPYAVQVYKGRSDVI